MRDLWEAASTRRRRHISNSTPKSKLVCVSLRSTCKLSIALYGVDGRDSRATNHRRIRVENDVEHTS